MSTGQQQQEGGYSLTGMAPNDAGDATVTRLLNGLPTFVMNYYGSKHPAPVAGMVPLHWEDGTEQFEKAVNQAFDLEDIEGKDETCAAGSSSGNGGDPPSSGVRGQGQQGLLQQGAGQGLSIGQSVMEQAAERSGVKQAAEWVSPEEFSEVCNHAECGKHAEPGQQLLKCARCGAGYCSRECQKAHWRQHKVVCCPEKLQYNVPAELETIHSLKRLAVSRMAEDLIAELSFAAVAFRERLGRGMLVVCMKDFIFALSPDAKQKCHLYMLWFPEADAPSRVGLVPGIKEQLQGAGGGKQLFRKFKEPMVPVLFQDHEFGLGMAMPLFFQQDACLKALRQGSTELREMDVLCLDTMANKAALVDFHNMHTAVASAEQQQQMGRQ